MTTSIGSEGSRAALTALSSLLAAALVAASCRDVVSPVRDVPGGRGFAQSPTGAHLTGLGAMGPGTATPGSDRQSFDFDVSDAPGGRLTYSDFSIVRPGGVATVTVDPVADPATAITSFTRTSTACATFAGTGRGDDGQLKRFAVAACDNGSPGAGVDSFRIWLPSSAYGKSGRLTDGEITLSGGSPPAATNRIAGGGTTGPGTPTLGSDLQEFDFDVSSTLSGRLFYRDWSAVRSNGGTVAVVTVDTDPATGITAYRNSSTACADSTHGVEFDGIGHEDTGEYFGFTVVACDNSPAGSGADFFRMSIPEAPNYVREGFLSSGDIAKNRPPTAAFTATCSGLTCAFSDRSNDPGGSVVAWQWMWGDGGTSTAQNPSHSYAAAGSYTVTLTVTDNQGATGSTSQTVTVTATAPNQPPSASFTVSCGGLTCGFTSTSGDPDGTITAYSWTFGDGTSATVQNPSHSYAATGSYTVTLTVTDNQGATVSTSQTVTVTLPNRPPGVSAGPDETVLLGLLYTLSASFADPDNDGPWSYTIAWGDGSSSSSSMSSQGTFTARHNYLLIGSYTIRVTVTDSHGASGSDTKVLTVLVNLGL